MEINVSPVLSNIHRYFINIFHEFKIMKKVITTETFNVDFHNKFIKFLIICFFNFSLHHILCKPLFLCDI